MLTCSLWLIMQCIWIVGLPQTTHSLELSTQICSVIFFGIWRSRSWGTRGHSFCTPCSIFFALSLPSQALSFLLALVIASSIIVSGSMRAHFTIMSGQFSGRLQNCFHFFFTYMIICFFIVAVPIPAELNAA
jgi:hypothetical protein